MVVMYTHNGIIDPTICISSLGPARISYVSIYKGQNYHYWVINFIGKYVTIDVFHYLHVIRGTTV